MDIPKVSELNLLTEQILKWRGGKMNKEKCINDLVMLYGRLGDNIFEDKILKNYPLNELTTDLFKLARQELEENEEKWRNPNNGRDKRYKGITTRLFELSLRHLRICCRRPVDHNTIRWIPFLLSMLSSEWIQSDRALESELTSLFVPCSVASQLHWADHSHLKQLWEFIWLRVGEPLLDDSLIKDYVDMAVQIMEHVDFFVFEKSIVDLIITVLETFRKLVEVDHKRDWTLKRKYSVVYIVSYIVRRWGLVSRDYILKETLNLTDYLSSLISVKACSGDSKSHMMHLVDDIIKLSMIETVKSHRTIDQNTEERVRTLVKTAIYESLKSACESFSSSTHFMISEEYIRYLARWFLVERKLDLLSEPSDESFDSTCSGSKKKAWNDYSLDGLIHLSFGANSNNKLGAWNGAMEIMIELLKTQKLDSFLSEKMVSILWEKRKALHSDNLRSKFCHLLSIVIPWKLRFGHKKIPTIEAILKYSLTLIPNLTSLANATLLAENILRYQSQHVSKVGIQMVWDTVSRTSPGSLEVIRLISAMISFTEFDENSRFANDENVGCWSFRKDLIEWLLTEPSANSHALLYELCQYHPMFCYDTKEYSYDDPLLEKMKYCKLVKSSLESPVVSQSRLLDAQIEEIVIYIHDKLESLSTSEVTLPIFVLCYEFSKKLPSLTFDIRRMCQELSDNLENMEEPEFLESVEHFSEWPACFKAPVQFTPSHITYLLNNEDNQLTDLSPWKDDEKFINFFAEASRKSPAIMKKVKAWMPFNGLVKEFILDKAGDPYEMAKRYEKFSFLLSQRHLIGVREFMLKKAEISYAQSAIGDVDMHIIDKLLNSAHLRNTSENLGGYHFDPVAVALHADHMEFDERSVKKYLKALRKLPFLAQNIVRSILKNGDSSWHLHGKMLKRVIKNEQLLAVCIATIPNMIRYLKIYQVNYPPKCKAVEFLNLSSVEIATCQIYLRKPKIHSGFITSDILILLFGCEKNTWKRTILKFWKLFQSQTALVCERLFEFATESIRLGLKDRLVSFLQALSTSEFSRKAMEDTELKMVFELTYRTIFLSLSREDCSPNLLALCIDTKIRYDVFQHRIRNIPETDLSDFQRFEEKIAFSVENFLKFGIESSSIDYMDFGLIEFYEQLNENLTERAIKGNETRNIYIVDILSRIWLVLPAMRPHILPIVARFKHISPAWSRFPQPPHSQPGDGDASVMRLRFNLTLKMMAFRKWSRGEFATCAMLLLTSRDEDQLDTDLIKTEQLQKLKLKTRRNVLCVLTKIIRKELVGKQDTDTVLAEIPFFAVLTDAASIFPDIAAFTVPLIFKVCVNSEKYEFAMKNLWKCLKGVNQEDQRVVYCIAECVDCIGLDVIARYERMDLNYSPLFSPHWYFVLARMFLKHGFLTHAFAIANILFDRLSASKRNVMMIDRISLEGIEKSEEMIQLLVDIYVAENNSVALSSLPSVVQNRPDVRRVMHMNSKEWMKLISSDMLNSQESTMMQWMCGLPSNSACDKYLDAILRFQCKEYPKHLDTPLKYIYFTLFHHQIGTKIPLKIADIIPNMLSEPTIDEMRLMMIANRSAESQYQFNAVSIQERVIEAVLDLRITVFWRENSQYQNALEVNRKTKRIVKLAELLTENNAYDAAILVLNSWEEECQKWKFPSIDIDIIKISKELVTYQSGDQRTSEINLRSMRSRVGSMSEVAIEEWTLALSKITIEYRNDLEEGIRILEFGYKNLKNENSVGAGLKILLKLHSVCLGQLSKLEEYLETRSYRMKKKVISEFETQIQNNSALTHRNSGEERTNRAVVQRVKKEQQIEKADVEKVERLVVSAARKAVSSAFDALLCIKQLPDDEEAIRVSSLIIFPLIDVIYKYERDAEIQTLLKNHAKRSVPSKLWLCATSHLASKCFSVEKAVISRYLAHILCNLVCDYPYHVLHTILMYEHERNGAEVRRFLNTVFVAATNSRDVVKLKEIVETMREVHFAYREIANLDAKGDRRIRKVEIDGKVVPKWPKDLKIFKCKLGQIPIPTISQKIGHPGDLSTSNLITWQNYKDTFTIADGLSTPKIWEIQGSDGKWYKTVWKKDDVRQDVLVEQMFKVTNNMLEKKILRTYNVVPLDTECGIIEFCGGTVSLKELLCGSNRSGGLHSEFNAGEQTAVEVSIMMKEVQGDTIETRRKVFKDICQRYSPVFRHFFYTSFSTAHIWRQKINDYRQSLAAWSVVCYIVGLGDRHASNILFDQRMCTFVHIDLGMILEYSKRSLPVPEQVPFRISRDILDPILIEGIDNGQLAEDCTRFMEKLKENGKVILGVASALLRETMSNFREAEQQPGRPSYISEMAIGRLRDKLRGTDDGVTAQPSNLQVRRLLREATNSDNLSRMFCGWMPFL